MKTFFFSLACLLALSARAAQAQTWTYPLQDDGYFSRHSWAGGLTVLGNAWTGGRQVAAWGGLLLPLHVRVRDYAPPMPYDEHVNAPFGPVQRYVYPRTLQSNLNTLAPYAGVPDLPGVTTPELVVDRPPGSGLLSGHGRGGAAGGLPAAGAGAAPAPWEAPEPKAEPRGPGLRVRLPEASAILYVDGALTEGDGQERFIAAPRDGEPARTLRLRAAFRAGADLLIEERTVELRGGASATVTFDGARALRVPLPK